MAVERTFALIKTGALDRGHRDMILYAAKAAGLQVIERRPFGKRVNPADMDCFARLYEAHRDMPYYTNLLCSVAEVSLAIVFEGPEAIAVWRELMGPTDPARAMETAPTSMRSLYGGARVGIGDMADNAVHGSDSPEAVAREIAIFYPKMSPTP